MDTQKKFEIHEMVEDWQCEVLRRRRSRFTWTAEEITEWCMTNGLYPPPSTSSSDAEIEAWENGLPKFASQSVV